MTTEITNAELDEIERIWQYTGHPVPLLIKALRARRQECDRLKAINAELLAACCALLKEVEQARGEYGKTEGSTLVAQGRRLARCGKWPSCQGRSRI